MEFSLGSVSLSLFKEVDKPSLSESYLSEEKLSGMILTGSLIPLHSKMHKKAWERWENLFKLYREFTSWSQFICSFPTDVVIIKTYSSVIWQASSWLNGKKSAFNVGDTGSIPGLGRSPGKEAGNLLDWYSCLENSMDRGGCWATVHEIAKELDMTAQLNSTNNLNMGIAYLRKKSFIINDEEKL